MNGTCLSLKTNFLKKLNKDTCNEHRTYYPSRNHHTPWWRSQRWDWPNFVCSGSDYLTTRSLLMYVHNKSSSKSWCPFSNLSVVINKLTSTTMASIYCTERYPTSKSKNNKINKAIIYSFKTNFLVVILGHLSLGPYLLHEQSSSHTLMQEPEVGLVKHSWYCTTRSLVVMVHDTS